MSPLDIEGCTTHRVRRGETLESLAGHIGISGRELARFNFGVDAPRLVNAALRAYVGTTRRDATGRNYVFDDADDPGIIYLPKIVPDQTLATGEPHVIRISRPRFKVPLDLETVDDLGRAVPNVALVLMREDAAFALDVTSDGKGIAHLDEVLAGRYEVLLEDSSPASFWRGLVPTRAPLARGEDVRLEPAVVDTLNRHAVTSVVVKRVPEEERRARSLLRQTHAFTATFPQARSRGSSIREETYGRTRRSLRFMCDNLVIAAGWKPGGFDEVDVQGLVRDILPGWMEDYCRAIVNAGYYVIAMDPARSVLTLIDRAGNVDHEFKFEVKGTIAGGAGAYALFEATAANNYLDIATRSYAIVDLDDPVRKGKSGIPLDEIVLNRRGFLDATAEYGWLHPVLLLLPTGKELASIAVNGASGLLEDYPAGPEANKRFHSRNMRVVKNTAAVYDAYIDRYVEEVKKKGSEKDLRALGPPLSQYGFPPPLGATDDQVRELYGAASEREFHAWVAIASKLDAIADRRSEGMPFLKFSVQYETDVSAFADVEKLRPGWKDVLQKVPASIKVEGNLDIAFDRLTGARFIKKGTGAKWSADVKLKAKSSVEGLTGDFSLKKGTPSVTATASGVPVQLKVKGPSAWEAVQGTLPGGKKYASAEIPDSSVGVKIPPFDIELKSDGSASVSVDVEGVTVESGWDPRSAEMSGGLSFSLNPLAKRLEEKGGKYAQWGKHLKGVKISMTSGLVGSREETVLAVVSRAPGFFERRDPKELLDPATDWSALTLDEQHFLYRLGWDETSWNTKFDPKARKLPESCRKNRHQLEPVEKVAIVGLGFHAYEDYAAAIEEALTEFEKKGQGSPASAAR